ncbi:NAD(P)-binding Rossmann-fold containing protein [Glarea lozoyensis ATCC 20868]|uniref:NAD(P)-binding Rossmann-fold containing protein n=1 Tax=Glarea lozoyensis (strain ATCC 20868 / MF5171) TaxID=1116229 RepID=S3D971_GLAL2|nr:NAD(P)-binding Rossmann-fold containing protein [Glarea lozoyensis ATCC 20868]EPE35027.1 NAD(P)-binding Rossmann-fold containing protein [Glarea lozoyensis ATCC 20868]
MTQRKTPKLYQKHILIIGGSSGLGYAVAELSLESSAKVTISSSSPKRIETAVSKLKEAFPDAEVNGHACDLSGEDVESHIVELFEKVGKVDHVVFTAGDALASMKISEIDLKKIQTAGQIRFFAPLLVAKHAAKYLSPGPESSIILTTGTVGDHPIPDWSVIAGYAAGLHGMTRNLAVDLKPIRVNCVSPGAVETELWDNMQKTAKETMMNQIAAKVPTGRIGRPEDGK